LNQLGALQVAVCGGVAAAIEVSLFFPYANLQQVAFFAIIGIGTALVAWFIGFHDYSGIFNRATDESAT
jgi:predicted exporter